ncbi:MAG: hypothetical protein ABFC96_17870 [Thermoguttaceae bacterium]
MPTEASASREPREDSWAVTLPLPHDIGPNVGRLAASGWGTKEEWREFFKTVRWDAQEEQEAVEESRTAQPSGNLLESLGKCSDKKGGEVRERWELRKCRCKCWYCPECAKWQGLALRRRVVDRVQGFSSVAMLHLTVDQTLFRGPQEAYEWVRSRHGIGRLIRELKRRGLVKSGRYFAVLEFQNLEKGGWPHWHVLVDAAYVDKYVLEELWGKLRPSGIEQVAGRPEFGIVRVTAGKKFRSCEHAANYATKYVIKTPVEGWPQWVLEYEGRIPRYSVSRGFWENKARASVCGRDVVAPPHPPECFCEACREGDEVATGKRQRAVRTIAERVAKCGTGTMLWRVRTEYDAEGKIVATDREWVAYSAASYSELCEVVDVAPGRMGRVPLDRWQMARISGEFFGGVGGSRDAGGFNRDVADWVPF